MESRLLKCTLCLWVGLFCLQLGSVYSQPNRVNQDKLKAMGVEFVFPEGWSLLNDAQYLNSEDGVGLFFIHPQAQAAITVIWNKKAGSDHQSFNAALSEYRQTLHNSPIRVLSEKRVNSKDSLSCFFTYDTKDSPRKRVKDCIIFKNNRTYNLIYAAGQDEFKKYLPVFEGVEKSFRVLR